VRTWLLRITVNVCRDWHRGHFGTHRRMTTALGNLDVRPPGRLGSRPSAHPGAASHAAALDLHSAINRLDEPLRVVVVLRYFAGLDATEIGSALGTPAPTIRTRLRRALALLREALRDSGEWPVFQTREGDDE
jgi:RNA polymerase sigma factor (sigma-70 family)